MYFQESRVTYLACVALNQPHKKWRRIDVFPPFTLILTSLFFMMSIYLLHSKLFDFNLPIDKIDQKVLVDAENGNTKVGNG